MRRAALLALATCLAAGCTSASPSTGDTAGPAGTEPEAATTTTVEPTPEATSVLLVGDSIMAELSDALSAAVESGGADHAGFLLAPNLPRTAVDMAIWRAGLRRVDPDVVVLHIGTWERLKVLGDFAVGDRLEPGTYGPEVIDPMLDLVADSGARLLWMSPVPVQDTEKAEFVGALADQWQAELVGRDDTEFVDVVPAIAPTGFVATLPGPDGHDWQVRRADGIHLCPPGQAVVAAAVVDRLATHLTAPPPPGWSATWLSTVHEPGGCRAGYEPTT